MILTQISLDINLKNEVNINLRANLGHVEGHLDRGGSQVGPWGQTRLSRGWVVLGPGAKGASEGQFGASKGRDGASEGQVGPLRVGLGPLRVGLGSLRVGLGLVRTKLRLLKAKLGSVRTNFGTVGRVVVSEH